MDREAVLHEIRAAFHSEPRFGPHGHLDLAFDDGTLTITGEVQNIAVKKLLLARAEAHPRVREIVDELRVKPAQRMEDHRIRDLVRDALLQEPAFAELTIRERLKGETVTVRAPSGPSRGELGIDVRDGLVTLEGTVSSVTHRRLAGVLAWWVPGTRDVFNTIAVSPLEEDEDDEVTDAVRMVLEKDPFVNASQIRIATFNQAVTLTGVVPTQAEREMAEFDAWYVVGVHHVENQIEVRPIEPSRR